MNENNNGEKITRVLKHHVELDYEATSAKIQECVEVQGRNIRNIMNEIDKYNNLKIKIIERKERLGDLESSFIKGQEAISKSHINTNLNMCVSCATNVQNALDLLLQECNNKIMEKEEELLEARKSKSFCATSANNKVYREWDSYD